MDPEEAHILAHKMTPLLSVLKTQTESWWNDLSPRLAVNIGGTRLKNPIGLAAGFDKNADLVEWLRLMGFGFAEIGSITGMASKGNPRPRLFRLPDDDAIINYLGLNGEGAENVARKLANAHSSLPLALSIAKTNNPAVTGDRAIEDFVTSFRAIKNLPMVFVSINVSCPNTHESKLAELNTLDSVLKEIGKLNDRKVPLFVKLSPDSDKELLEGVVALAIRHSLTGFICGNTSQDRSGLKTESNLISKIGPGGLSGPPIREKALNLCRQVYQLKAKEQQIIGCGGITSGADAFKFISSGASALQIYTALIYHGPFLPFAICRELGAILEERDLTVEQAVGMDMEVSVGANN